MQLRILLCLLCSFAAAPGGLFAAGNASLQLNPASSHQAEVKSLGEGAYSVRTTGEDPYVTTLALPEGAVSPQAAVLAFEYFCPDGLNHIEVFFGPPIQGGTSAKGGPLPPSEVWRPAALNLKTLADGKWGGPARQFRLDFGSLPGVQLQLRNLHFRELNPEELAEEENAGALLKSKENDAAAIRAYLEREYSAWIAAVRIEGEALTMEGRAEADGEAELLLAELQMHEEPWRAGSRGNTTPLQTGPAGGFRVVLPRYDAGRDRLFSRWQLVRKKHGTEAAASHARHATELPGAEISGPPQQTRKTKKGMGGVTLNPIAGELQELGVEHVTVNIVLNSFFRSGAGPDTIPYEFEGRSYALAKNALAGMDRTLLFFGNFAEVSAILLVGMPKNPLDRSLLNHPEARAPGMYAMPNLTTPEGVHAYRAALAFLAKRYAGGPHGRITHWILHNEVDQAFAWTNMGEQPMDIIMDHYVRSMRLAYLSARQFSPSAKVFISLTHHWTAPEGTSLQHYRPKEMLDRLADYSRLEGDFEWGVAYHPYPQGLFQAATWNDKRPSFSFDSPYITPKNIEVLDAYLHRQPLLYRGEKLRSVLLSEQGFHSKDYSHEAQQLQAAALVYTWHKIRPLSTIEAFHNHRWIDHRGEGGLLLGLRTLPDAAKPFGERKSGWSVYQALDTPGEESASAFAKEIIGVTDFAQIPYRGPILEHLGAK
jgi:hypothetical protein